MPLAKKATLNDANIKVLVWGESGSGKSRFALSAPNPLVIDLEGSTRLYAEEFDFFKAEIDSNNKQAANPAALVKNIINEIHQNEYSDRKTLVIDPLTDLLDYLEQFCAEEYEKQTDKKISDLNAVQKSKWYAYRREMARKFLNMLKDVNMNVILVARSKAIWDKLDGKMQPVGQTYDCLEIVEYLMDIVINLEKTSEGTIAKVKKSRLANLPSVLPVQNFSSIYKAIEETKASSKQKDNKESLNSNTEIRNDNAISPEEANSFINIGAGTSSDKQASSFDYEEMMRLQKKHIEEGENE